MLLILKYRLLKFNHYNLFKRTLMGNFFALLELINHFNWEHLVTINVRGKLKYQASITTPWKFYDSKAEKLKVHIFL